MDKEIERITEPQELMKWMSQNDVLIDLSVEDVTLLLGYLEGHDYAIGTNKAGDLVRVDLASEDMDEYSMDDLIDQVCEWNYELILDAEYHKQNSADELEQSHEESRYEAYKNDEVRLDRMFEQTKYGKETEEIAMQLAKGIIEMLGENPEKIAAVVADGIKQYSAERGR